MYKCKECGHIFEEGEEKKWTEPHGEKLKGCPICFGAFEEAEQCKICGGYSLEMEDGFCQECLADVDKRFRSLLLDNFNEWEIEALNCIYDVVL